MDNFAFLKRGYRTKEFILTVLFLFGGAYPLFVSPNVMLWSYGLTILCSGYPISRRLMKRGRGMILYGGERSTEIYVVLAGIAGLWFAHHFFHLDACLAYLESCIIVTAWSISCGHSKSIPPVTTIIR